MLKHPFRVAVRLAWLGGELGMLAVVYVFRVTFRGEQTLTEARARWLQAGCRRVLRVLHADVHATGDIPTKGLLVSNHLGYLDILVLGALAPSVFVAKRDVKRWPVFGWFALLGGTLFADREKRLQVGELAKRLRTVLDEGALVVLFPEGTSSSGETVLPFKSSLLEPATGCNCRLTVSRIGYKLEDGDAGNEVCYWRDMVFVPHLLNLLSKGRVEASVSFSGVRDGCADRKVLARQLHHQVMEQMVVDVGGLRV